MVQTITPPRARPAWAFPFFVWPAPDLNPQENVWGWAEDRLRKTEKQQDTVASFKRGVHAICKQYPGGAKLVPGLVRRMALCIKRKGAPIGM